MGGTTAKGWPYVTPDDHPKEFPAHSQALGTKLDAALTTGAATGLKLARGATNGAVIGPYPASRADTVVFPVGLFTAAPTVVAGNGGATDVDILVSAHNITAAGCTLHVQNISTANKVGGAHWIAVGV